MGVTFGHKMTTKFAEGKGQKNNWRNTIKPKRNLTNTLRYGSDTKIHAFQGDCTLKFDFNGNGTKIHFKHFPVVSLHFIRFQNGHNPLFGT